MSGPDNGDGYHLGPQRGLVGEIAALEYFAGLDVSLDQTSVCIVDEKGKTVRETKVASDPDALVALFAGAGVPLIRVGLEAGRCRSGCMKA